MTVTSAPAVRGYVVVIDGGVRPDAPTLERAAQFIAADYGEHGRLRQTRVTALVKGRRERDLTAAECSRLTELTMEAL